MQVAVLVVVLGVFLAAPVRAADVDDSVFAEAAQLFGVPEPLVRAWVEVESRGHMNPGVSTRDGRWGLTGLAAGRTLERAAELTGFSTAELTTDARANLLGGVAVLAELAQTSGSLEETLFRWAGFDMPEAGWEYAGEVVARLVSPAEYVRLAFPRGRGLVPDGRGAPPFRVDAKATPDYPEARWVGPACSYTNGSRSTVEMVIIHTCEGGFSGCWSWLTGCHDVSAHYVVSNAGDVVQCVEDQDVAWHAGCVNSRSIGIEHEGSATRPEDFSDAMYCASARLTRWLSDNHGVPRDRDHIIGHGEANDLYCGGTHWDPGPGWDWTKYMDYVECGCGGCVPRRPVFELRAEIDTIPDQARDACTLYDSAGIFDMTTGQTTIQRFYVTNNGDAVGRNVIVGLWIEEPYLRLRHWDIYDNWPTHTCGAEWCLNDSNSHPENPAHDDPGAALALHLYALSPGETKMVEMRVEATALSLGLADHPDVRLWVRHVDDFYEKADFWSTDFNNVGGYQTFNGGDLRVWSETDVLAPETCDGLDDDCNGQVDEGCVADESVEDAPGDDARTDSLTLDVPPYDAGGPDAGDGGGGGCGCRTTSAPGAAGRHGTLVLLAALGLVVRRVRRRG